MRGRGAERRVKWARCVNFFCLFTSSALTAEYPREGGGGLLYGTDVDDRQKF